MNKALKSYKGVCVCMYVCEREGERWRERGKKKTLSGKGRHGMDCLLQNSAVVFKKLNYIGF